MRSVLSRRIYTANYFNIMLVSGEQGKVMGMRTLYYFFYKECLSLENLSEHK